MRRQHWFLPILSLSVLIANSANALADDGYDNDSDTSYREAVEYGPDVQGNFSTALQHEQTPYYTSQDLNPPPGFDMTGYDPSQVPSHSAVVTGANGQHQLPPQFGPYPQISPFDQGAFQQHSMEDGMWMKETRGKSRRYTYGVDFLKTYFRYPVERVIGNSSVQWNPFSGTALATFSDFWRYNYPATTRTAFTHWGGSSGIQAHWGYQDEDETGFEFSAFWTGELENTQEYGDLQADPFVVESINVLNPGLPLEDGLSGSGIGTPTYDLGVEYKYSQEAFGAHLNWIMSPKISRRNWQLQGVYGVRYLGIRERFSFHGKDSGAGYTITFANTFATPPVISNFVPGVVAPYQGLLISTTSSHLLGPEGGFKLEMGGDNLKLTSTTKVGLMANRERTDLKARGLGNGFVAGYQQGLETSYKEETTHISPLVDFSLMAEANIFPIIPVVKRWKILRDAKLRGGWQFLNVWEVQRPTDAIVYRAPPANPHIRSRRTSWSAQMWHLGIVWEK